MMSVLRITYNPVGLPAPVATRANDRGNIPFGEVKLPPNGNPGIVPPWLQVKPMEPKVIGLVPEPDPDTPHIM
jgi:hypothetical protein